MNMPLPEFQRLRTRIALSLALLSLAVSGLVMFFIAQQVHSRTLNLLQQQLIELTRLAAVQVDASAQLSPEDPSMQASLEVLLESTEDLEQAALLQVLDGKVILVASTARPTGAGQGTFLQNYPWPVSNLEGLQNAYVEGAYRRELGGYHLMGYAPLQIEPAGQAFFIHLALDASRAIAQERNFLIVLLLIFASLVLASALLGWLLAGRMTQSLLLLTEGIERWTKGDLTYRIQPDGSVEIRSIGRALNRMADILHQILVKEEEKALKSEHRRARLETATRAILRAAAAASPELEPPNVEHEVLQLFLETYHLGAAGIYRMDASGDCAVLSSWAAASGEGLAPLQQIQAGVGIAGQVLAEALQDGKLVSTNEAEEGHNPKNEEAEARNKMEGSEATLPLQARGRLLGLLWFRSPDQDAFYDEKLKNIGLFAEMVALILDNLDHQAHSPAAQPVQRFTSGRRVEGLEVQPEGHFLGARPPTIYQAGEGGVTTLLEGDQQLDGQWQTHSTLSLPIQLRGQTIGSLDLQKSPGGGDWTPDERDLVNKLVEQLSAALESARLYEETKRRAELERMAGDIIGKIRAENNPYTILNVATEELRRALGASRAQVHLHPSLPEEGPGNEQRTDLDSDEQRGEK